MTCVRDWRSKPRDARSVAIIMESLPWRYALSVLREADDLLDLMIVPIRPDNDGSSRARRRERQEAD